MWWTTPYTRHTTQINKQETRYVLDNTIHKTQNTDKQTRNTICVGYHYTQANTNNVNKT